MKTLKVFALLSETKMNLAIFYIVINVLGGAVGQVMLKKGMSNIGPLTLTAKHAGSILLKIGLNPFVLLGLGIYGLSTLFWLLALSRVDLSFAYPFVSLSYVLMLVASWFIFNENITPLRLLGSLTIIIGVFMVSRS